MSIIKINRRDINYLTHDAISVVNDIEGSDNGYVYLDGGVMYYSPVDVEFVESFIEDCLDFWQVSDDSVRNDYQHTKRQRLCEIRIRVGSIEQDVIRLSKIPADELVFSVQDKFFRWDYKLTSMLNDALMKRDMLIND